MISDADISRRNSDNVRPILSASIIRKRIPGSATFLTSPGITDQFQRLPKKPRMHRATHGNHLFTIIH
ncbi:hypothetical protein OHD23_21075 [Escherichia coli]|nr:hypothetical protein [Escherichia coli]